MAIRQQRNPGAPGHTSTLSSCLAEGKLRVPLIPVDSSQCPAPCITSLQGALQAVGNELGLGRLERRRPKVVFLPRSQDNVETIQTHAGKDIHVDYHYIFRGYRMNNIALIERVKQVIAQAFEEGWTRQEGIDRLNAELIAAGVEPLDCYHSELLWQTGTTTAYMQRRVQQMRDPAVALALPWWHYRTRRDESVRPNHAALDGFVARYDDPVWKHILPPLGFNCRCDVEALLRTEGEKILGGQIDIPGEQRLPVGAGPDEGFDRTPWAFLRNVESAPEYDEYAEDDEED